MLTRESYRNSFHPAWLAILIPSSFFLFFRLWRVEGWERLFLDDIAAMHGYSKPAWATILGIAVAGSFLMAWIRSRFNEVSPRARRWFKEARPLLPGSLLAVGSPTAAWFIHNMDGVRRAGEISELCLILYALGCAAAAGTLFGSEFDQKTMQSLLCQPVERARIFLEKMGVLAAVLLLNFLLIWPLGIDAEMPGDYLIMISLLAFCGGPFFSLVSRSTLPAVVFTLAGPPICGMVAWIIISWISRVTYGEDSENMIPRMLVRWLPVCGIAYCLGTLIGGFRLFARLESRETGLSRGAVLTHPASNWLDRRLGSILPSSSWVFLARKELRLHSASWLISGIMFGSWILWMLAKAVVPEGSIKDTLSSGSTVDFITFAGFLIGGLSILFAGCSSVSEERQLGMLEWQQVQPVKSLHQWLIKIGVALGSAILLGVVVPVVLLAISPGLREVFDQFRKEPFLWGILGTAITFCIFSVGVYASSISRYSIKSAATAIGLLLWSAFIIYLGGSWTRYESNPDASGLAHSIAMNWNPETIMALVVTLLGTCVAATNCLLLGMAKRNASQMRTSPRRVIGQWALLSVIIVTIQYSASQVAYSLDTAAARRAEQMQQRVKNAPTLIIQKPNPATPTGADVINTIPPDIARRYGLVPAPARPGKATTNSVSAQPPAESNTFRGMSPEMMRRYGLGQPPAKPGKTTTNEALQQKNSPAMDPELMKRYGLPPK